MAPRRLYCAPIGGARGRCAGVVARVGTNDDAVVEGCIGWATVRSYAELTVDGRKLVPCHRPFGLGVTWKGSINGHSHGRLKSLPRQFDVGVHVWDFRPVSLSDILAKKARTIDR